MPTITAHIREPSGVQRNRWPITTGIPFAQGVLRSPEHLQLQDHEQAILPSHAEVRATWPDSSIKWLLLDAQVDILPMERATFTVNYGEEVNAPELKTPLNHAVRDDYVDVSTGHLTVRLARTGHRLFESVSQERREFLRQRETGEFTARDEDGKLYGTEVEEVVVEESNPLRLVIKASGGYVAADGTRLMSWLARLYFYAHQDFFKIYHTFVHDQPADFAYLRQLRFSLPLALDPDRKAALGARSSWFGHGVELQPLEHPLSLVQWNVERHVVFDQQRTDYRTNAHGWIHLADAHSGVTLKLRRPWQNYPKTLATDGTALDLDLYPDLGSFRKPEVEPGRRWTEVDRADGVEYTTPLRVPQGMAKTHEFFLRFGKPGSHVRAVDSLCLAFEQPLLLMLPSEYYADTKALGPFQPFRDEYWPLELKLRQFCKTPNGLGLLDCGDQVKLARVDGSVRTLTTENLAYELPQSILRQYLRSQDQTLFWEGEAAVMHLMDVDTVHFSTDHPEWVGGPYFEWSQNHHYATTDEDLLSGPYTSHTWLGSLLDYYFLTGYQRAREVAEQVADFCRKAAPYQWKQRLTPQIHESVLERDQEWEFSTRVAGWALTAMGTFYAAFRHERFLRSMEALVDLFETWQDSEGRWREQIGSFNRGATPFMNASVLQGLQLYHQSTGDERTRRLLLQGAHFLADQARTIDGIFFYKESPISDRPHASTAMLLGPLTFAFEETRDPKILDAGYRLFRWLIDGDQVSTYMLKDLFAFMPLLERLDLLTDYRGRDITAHLERLNYGQTAPVDDS